MLLMSRQLVRAQTPELVAQTGHASRIFSLAFSQDNRLLASGGEDKRIVLWDVVTGLEIRALIGHDNPVTYVGFPDNNTLLSSSSNNRGLTTFRVWDINTGRELISYGPVSELHQVNLSLGVIASLDRGLVGYNDAFKIWDIKTGKELLKVNAIEPPKSLPAPIQTIKDLAFKDDKSIATLFDDSTIIVWDLKSGQKLQTYTNTPCSNLSSFPDDETVLCMERGKQFSSDIKRLSFNLKTQKVMVVKEDNPDPKTALPQNWAAHTFSPDGKLKAGVQRPSGPGSNNSLETVIKNLKDMAEGKILAAEDKHDTIKIWDTATGRELKELRGHSNLVESAMFSADGKFLVSGYEQEAQNNYQTAFKLWDLTNARTLITLAGQPRPSTMSRDRRLLAIGSREKMVNILDAATGTEITTLGPLCTSAFSLAISPDNRFLATGDWCNEIRVWEIATKKIRWQAKVPSELINPILSLAFSSDGSKLVSKQNFNAVWGRGYADARKYITVKVWDALNGQELTSFKADTPYTVFTPDGQGMVVTSIDNRIRLTDLRNGREWKVGSQDEHIHTVAFSNDGKLMATGGEDNLIKLWDFATGSQVRSIDAHSQTGFVAFTHSARILASVNSDSAVHLWDVASGRELQKIKTGLGPIMFSPDDTVMVVMGQSGSVELFDVATGKIVRILSTRPLTTFLAGAFSADGKRFVSFHSDGTLRNWSLTDGSLIKSLKMFSADDNPTDLILSPDGKLAATAMTSDGIIVWDTDTGRELKKLATDGLSVDSLSFSADGRKLACICEGGSIDSSYSDKVAVWDVWTGKRLKMIKGFAYFVALSPDANILASPAESESIKLWDIRNSVELRGFDLGRGEQADSSSPIYSYALAISPDGKTIASGDSDLTIRLIDVETGVIRAKLRGHTDSITSLDFSPDGKTLSSSSRDGLISLWDVAGGKKIASMIAFDQSDFLIVTPDNYYTATKVVDRGVGFRLNKSVFPFEQFDLRLNRPDKVLERFGASSDEIVRAYRQAYQKRLKLMGLKEEMLGDDLHLPEVEIDSRDLPLATTEKNLKFKVKARDSSFLLNRLNVFINDVPVYGIKGIDLRERAVKNLESEISVELSGGNNKVQVSVLNEKGVESLRQTFNINYTVASPRPTLYVLAIGVSKYADSAYNLNYADKDASDLISFFQSQKERFSEVKVLPLLNAQATKKNILEARAFLMQSKVDDEVVLFMAGHATLDNNLDYYFGTPDIDFERPAENGLGYEEIEGLLDGIPARRKLLLMDTCHAGEVDKDETKVVQDAGPTAEQSVLTKKGIKTQSFPRASVAGRRVIGLGNSYELMQELFRELRRGSGATVISAASGVKYAYEADGNGVFTHAVLEGLKGKADRNGDHVIRVSELQDYVVKLVEELTEGNQKPTSRRENLEYDFSVY